MTDQLCSFELCKLAKEIGFDEPCEYCWEWYILDGKEFGPLERKFTYQVDWEHLHLEVYENFKKRPGLYEEQGRPHKNSELQPWLYARPSMAYLADWLRLFHKVFIGITPSANGDSWASFVRGKIALRDNNHIISSSYEEALSQQLLYALQWIKSKSNIVPSQSVN